MRALRILALIGVLVVAAVVARDYIASSRQARLLEADEPAAISGEVASQSAGWTWSQTAGEQQAISIEAGGFRQDRDRSGIELTDVRLKIVRQDAGRYDLVVTPKAIFDVENNLFHSEVQVDVTLGLPLQGEAREAELTKIRTTQATFNTKTGVATTDSEAFYEFDGGRGRSLGAHYDSAERLFHMRSQARVERFPSVPGGPSTLIEAGSLYYHEADERIDLREGCRLDRGGRLLEAREAEVWLAGGSINRVTARDATGRDAGEGRSVRFETPQLEAFYSAEGLLEHAVGTGRTKLTSEGESGSLRAEGDRVDLNYQPSEEGGDSVLHEAHLRGWAFIESTPREGAAGQRRKVSAPWVRLEMRPGGRELARMETFERGYLELFASAATPRRELRADRMQLEYAAGNRMERLLGNGEVELVRHGRADGEPALTTRSGSLAAEFDPDLGEMRSLEQHTGFSFEQGERQGSAGAATFDAASGAATLTSQARVTDPGVSIAAHRIVLDQLNDGLEADGGVTAHYEQLQETEARPSGVFSGSEPVYAAAAKMRSQQSTGLIVYEGAARLWQGEQRIAADRIVIDRQAQTLEARGAVTSRLIDRPSPDADPIPINVRAAELDYSEAASRAEYRGSVRFERLRLQVDCDELTAQLSKQGENAGAGLERALAQGSVQVTEAGSGRRGLGDKATYDVIEDRVVLSGAPARAVNAEGEETRGSELTYRIDDDSLLVLGGEERAYTYRRR